MPRYWGLLVRPLRLEPTPFLCAMGASAERDVGDADLGELLPMSGLAAIVLAPLELDDVDLGLLAHPDDLRLHLGAGDERRAGADGLAVRAEEDFIEGDLGARLRLHQREANGLALFGPELLAQGPENRVHGVSVAECAAKLACKHMRATSLRQGEKACYATA